MNQMMLYFLQGAALAISSAVTPGPFQAFLLSRALKSGWRRTLPAALAPLITDGPILVLVLLILANAAQWVLEALRVAGGVFILYIAKGIYGTLKVPPNLSSPSRKEAAGSLLNAVVINALNPNPYIFWSVVGGPLVLSGWRESPWIGAGFLIGFFGTFVASLAVTIILFATAGRLDPKLTRILYVVALTALAVFGLYQIVRGIIFWL